MFILPIFRAIDWRRPPLFTLLLILINCFVFFVFQAGDNAIEQKAVEFYVDSELPAIEFPLYLDYLKQTNQFNKAEQLKPLLGQRKEVSFPIFIAIERDPAFQDKIRSQALLPKDHAKFDTWRELRAKYRQDMASTVVYRFGLTPAESNPVTFLSHMFLHGDISHLLGNMVFLFILGFVIETVIPKPVFLLSYLLAGIGSAALDVYLHSASHIVSIGASGAISGLMGMYTLLFGLRKVKMFFFVLVYFDFFTAPAIILLPIWLGHEFYQLVGNPESNVNYTAHIGGLLSGAILGFLFRRLFPLVDDDYIDAPEKDEAYNRRLTTALNHMAGLRYNLAKPLLVALARERPDNANVLFHLFNIAKSNPSEETFHSSAVGLLSLDARDVPTLDRIDQVLGEYSRLAKPPRTNPAHLIKLAKRFNEAGLVDKAERLAQSLVTEHPQLDGVADLLYSVAIALKKQNKIDNYRLRLKQLVNTFPGAREAAEARSLLDQMRN